MSFNCILIVTQLVSIVTLTNAVPLANVDEVAVNNLTSVPDPVNINGSLTVLDTTEATIDLTTISSNSSTKNESREGRSDDGPIVLENQESAKNESKESSSAIRFPREDDIDTGMINSTSFKASVDQDTTNSPVAEISLDSNSTLAEGLIESSTASSSTPSSSSSSTTTTMKPSTTGAPIVDPTSSIAPRIGRSQLDTTDDEISANLNDTLLVLTTLSSILNQSTTNEPLSTV